MRVAIFLCTKGILESGVQWDHPNSLVVLHYFRRVFAGLISICVFEINIAQRMFRSPANNRALKTQSPILLPRPGVALLRVPGLCGAPARPPGGGVFEERVGVGGRNARKSSPARWGGISKLVRHLPDPNRHLDLRCFGRENILLAS